MQAKVQMAREKVVAATQHTAARPQPSAAAELISAATTSIESRERCAEATLIQFTSTLIITQLCRHAAVLPPGSNKYTQPKLAAEE
jgi:hypothetical protein